MTFEAAARRAVDDQFKHFGAAAVYYRKAAPTVPVDVVVLARRSTALVDLIDASVLRDATAIDVRQSEIEQPDVGDLIEFMDQVLRVRSKPQALLHRLVWRFDFTMERR